MAVQDMAEALHKESTHYSMFLFTLPPSYLLSTRTAYMKKSALQ
ncbi:MAG: hypothetical protein AAGE59_10160 [Cyanobacteria bacterium P01_F01_bin.86]